MNTSTTIRFVYGLLIGMVIFMTSCSDDIINNDDRNYPIDLTIEYTENGPVQLSWSPTLVSSFEKYIIVRSLEPISDSIVPNALISIREIEDMDSTYFEDPTFPIGDDVYYKVFSDIGDHIVFSETKSVQPNIALFDIQYVDAVIDYDDDHVYILGQDGQNGRKLIRYNYKTKVSKSTPIDWVPNRIVYLENGPNSDIYLFGINDNRYDIFDPNSLARRRSAFLDISISDLLPSKNGLTYVTNRSSFRNLYVIDQSDQTVLHKHTLREISDFSTLGFMDQAQTRLIEASRRELNLYTMSGTGTVQDRIMRPINFKTNMTRFPVSSDGKYVFPYRDLTYYDQDMNPINEDTFMSFFTITFSDLDDRVFTTLNRSIMEFDFPGLNLVKQFDLLTQPVNLFYEEGNLIVLESFASNQGEVKVVLRIIEL